MEGSTCAGDEQGIGRGGGRGGKEDLGRSITLLGQAIGRGVMVTGTKKERPISD